MKTSPCPKPGKSRYATREAATSAARRVTLKADLTLTPYECACTWWHLTKGSPQQPVDPSGATPQQAMRLELLPDVDLREIAAQDARAEGDPIDRASLRHDGNLKRWHKALTELIADANKQLTARAHDTSLAAHDWRRRTTGYRDNLVIRLNECDRLRADAHMRAHQARIGRQQDLETARARSTTVSELRRLAGEVAIDRLIAAHSTEFATYLADAYSDAGITLPQRIARRLPEKAA